MDTVLQGSGPEDSWTKIGFARSGRGISSGQIRAWRAQSDQMALGRPSRAWGGPEEALSLIHISEPTRLALI
eukprot:9724593-Alexandrium_andersonii.AAC.1